MLQICQNIRQARLNKGLSQQKTADLLGEKRTTYANWENETEPDLTKIREIAKIFDVSFTDLVEGNIEAKTPKDRHITTRNHLKQIGESKKGIMVYESAPTPASIKTVYHDEHAVPDYVLNIPQFRDCNYGTRASGDSMYPEIRNGDLIICKELPLDARIIFGDMYVIHTKDGIETIKYVQQFADGNNGDQWVLLVPHNKSAGIGTPIPRNEIIKLFKVRAIFKAY